MARRSIANEAESVRQRLVNRPIGLFGLIGAGKTSVGRRLADKLEIPFVDADQEIEQAAGKTIAEIFADHGESYFREGERRVIQRLINTGAQVLATGGGGRCGCGASVTGRGSCCIWRPQQAGLLRAWLVQQCLSIRHPAPSCNAHGCGSIVPADATAGALVM